jgi:hypothetical protein
MRKSFLSKLLVNAYASTTPYRSHLMHLLKMSTLTPGKYVPSQAVRDNPSTAVFCDGKPVILCGWVDLPESGRQARDLAESGFLKVALEARGLVGPITHGIVKGSDIEWPEVASAIIAKPSGQVEYEDGGEGEVVAIVLDDPHGALTVALCVNTETARALDPNAPELDDGNKLSLLARMS